MYLEMTNRVLEAATQKHLVVVAGWRQKKPLFGNDLGPFQWAVPDLGFERPGSDFTKGPLNTKLSLIFK